MTTKSHIWIAKLTMSLRLRMRRSLPKRFGSRYT